MAHYKTEFLSVYIQKNAQEIKQELTLIGELFVQINMTNLIKGFDWEVASQIEDAIDTHFTAEYLTSKTFESALLSTLLDVPNKLDIKDTYPLLSDTIIRVLMQNRKDLVVLYNWRDALCILDNTGLPAHTPEAAINRMEVLENQTHLNLSISRKHDASAFMDHAVNVLVALFGNDISLMRRVCLDEMDRFSTDNAVNITPKKRSPEQMTEKKGQPVSIDFYDARGDYAGRGYATIFNKDDDDDLDPFLQDIINTQASRMDDGWQREHSIIVESMENDDRNAFYHHVMRLFTPEQMRHLTKDYTE